MTDSTEKEKHRNRRNRRNIYAKDLETKKYRQRIVAPRKKDDHANRRYRKFRIIDDSEFGE